MVYRPLTRKVCVETDPVRNLCKGRAKVMVRYNPKTIGVRKQLHERVHLLSAVEALRNLQAVQTVPGIGGIIQIVFINRIV